MYVPSYLLSTENSFVVDLCYLYSLVISCSGHNKKIYKTPLLERVSKTFKQFALYTP